MTLTDELGDVPPPSHAWTAPVVEDMLREARAGLTEAVVISPGRAILFYGRHLIGEGLKADEGKGCHIPPHRSWDLGRKIGLSHCTDPVTIQEGRKTIAQAILHNRVKARGPGHPQVNLQAQQPFKFNTPRTSPPREVAIHYSSDDE